MATRPYHHLKNKLCTHTHVASARGLEVPVFQSFSHCLTSPHVRSFERPRPNTIPLFLIRLSLSQSTYTDLPGFLSPCPSLPPLLSLPLFLSFSASISLSIFLSIYLSIYLSISLSRSLSLSFLCSLSLSLSLWLGFVLFLSLSLSPSLSLLLLCFFLLSLSLSLSRWLSFSFPSWLSLALSLSSLSFFLSGKCPHVVHMSMMHA